MKGAIERSDREKRWKKAMEALAFQLSPTLAARGLLRRASAWPSPPRCSLTYAATLAYSSSDRTRDTPWRQGFSPPIALPIRLPIRLLIVLPIRPPICLPISLPIDRPIGTRSGSLTGPLTGRPSVLLVVFRITC
ncbi:predicted protein [Verticillium alfalfae VaMs.102]|uniref:Predicted protein n=1 Tax=Verticillium alfalfae (strain VaMs.102 / ATCC MYA-4576 / FGSC 10136) TaxID=526221 RepID=C9SNV8_VERA1|nr:predicted protein [Verticillium alfalfae VaMs.102]EEY20473.1 predicted protein [Verticillium alfalfae VaMs.102]